MENNALSKRILVTGSTGFLGRAVVSILKNIDNYTVIQCLSKQYNLTNINDCIEITKNIDIIINLAGLVVSRAEQQKRPAEVFTQNTLININIAEAARINAVKKIIFVSSVVAYPEHCELPMKEADLWSGPVSDSNYAYGTAKRLIETIARVYKEQFELDVVTLFLPNLYGPKDKFDYTPPPLIPSIIKQLHEALVNDIPNLHGGNNGETELDLLYVTDAASAILDAVQKDNIPMIMNISTGTTISIKNIYAIIAKELGYKGSITWDKGTPSAPRIMDTSLAFKHLSWKSEVPFSSGIKQTINDYIINNVQ